MKNEELEKQLTEVCNQYGIFWEHCGFGSVEVRTREGFQFEPELHGLVSSPWDGDTYRHCLKAAIKDAREYGPMVKPCPVDCPCKETD